MNDVIKDFLNFLNDEYASLVKIKQFLADVPEMIAEGKVQQAEFQSFMEKYEVQTSNFIFEKNRHKELIAQKMRIQPDQVTFKLLVHIGHKEFENMGRKVVKISNEIAMNLAKISVFMKNFALMQQEFKRLNNFLYQKDYTPTGVRSDAGAYNFNLGRNYYGEA